MKDEADEDVERADGINMENPAGTAEFAGVILLLLYGTFIMDGAEESMAPESRGCCCSCVCIETVALS